MSEKEVREGERWEGVRKVWQRVFGTVEATSGQRLYSEISENVIEGTLGKIQMELIRDIYCKRDLQYICDKLGLLEYFSELCDRKIPFKDLSRNVFERLSLENQNIFSIDHLNLFKQIFETKPTFVKLLNIVEDGLKAIPVTHKEDYTFPKRLNPISPTSERHHKSQKHCLTCSCNNSRRSSLTSNIFTKNLTLYDVSREEIPKHSNPSLDRELAYHLGLAPEYNNYLTTSNNVSLGPLIL